MNGQEGDARQLRFGQPVHTDRLVWFRLDGVLCPAYPGDTIAAALYAAGRRAWRRSRGGEPRGLLCGIGMCFDCLVSVDGVPGVRACLTEVHEGMVVETSQAEGEDR
jgi:hypothetical protein